MPLKVFQSSSVGGDTTEHWDRSWEAQAEPDPTSTCERDPVFPLVQAAAARGGVFLEGGCGQAQWVRYWAARGQKVVGIDFAPRTVQRLRAQFPELDVRIGDVTKLDLPDRSVQTYYSAGVVEHFEPGPALALGEAHRVLRPGGTFLCSVPDVSPLRALLYRRPESTNRTVGWTVQHIDDTRPSPPPSGMTFFQYMFAEPDFRSRLEAAGFRVRSSVGMHVSWGLMEIPGFASLLNVAVAGVRRVKGWRRSSSSTVAEPASTTPSASPIGPPLKAGFVERALLREDPSTPIVGPLVHWASELAPNMRMYVAERI